MTERAGIPPKFIADYIWIGGRNRNFSVCLFINDLRNRERRIHYTYSLLAINNF